MRNITATLCGLTLSAWAIVPAIAAEGDSVINFGGLAVGNVTTLTPSHLFWAGAFSGALFDEAHGPFDHAFVTCPGTNDLDFGAGTSVISGYCLISDGADSAIIATFACTGAPGTCEDGTATWHDGSGKWQGWTAVAKWTAQLGKALENGSVPFHANWSVHYTSP